MSIEYNNLIKEVNEMKEDLKNINNKIDILLEIMDNLTIMIVDEDEDEDNEDGIYDSDDSWVPDNEFDDWGNYEDES